MNDSQKLGEVWRCIEEAREGLAALEIDQADRFLLSGQQIINDVLRGWAGSEDKEEAPEKSHSTPCMFEVNPYAGGDRSVPFVFSRYCWEPKGHTGPHKKLDER